MSVNVATIFFDQAVFCEEAAALNSLPEQAGTQVFGIDLSSPNGAIEALIAAKRAGVCCGVFAILPDPFEATLDLILNSIASTADPNLQVDQFIALRIDQLMVNGRPPSELTKMPAAHENASALVLRLADILLLASPGDVLRFNAIHTRLFRRFTLLPVSAAKAPSSFDESGVTIYAPSSDAARLAPYEALLRQRRIEPTIIARANANDALTTRVVVTPEWRPMRARALAAAGHRVVAPNTTGVDACDSRIIGYLPADYRSFLGALDNAFDSNGGASRIEPTAASVIQAVEHEAARFIDGPRVSIIVRTFDRPALLVRAIASIANQSYKNIEIVVVNNGGEDVQSIVESAAAGRPFRYEVMPERKLISAASNVGARVATGEYVGYLDDDDLLYGDHCARTADALTRTKADLVFTVCVGEYAEIRGDEKHVLGYQVYLDRQYHPDDIYVSNMSPIHSIVHQRAIFERIGYFDEALPVTDDWELWLRLASSGARFVRIERATCEYSWRYDPTRGNMTVDHQMDFVRAFDAITDRYAQDVANRPGIRASQANARAGQAQRAQDALDPEKRASIVIGSMSSHIVPVAPDWERRSRT